MSPPKKDDTAELVQVGNGRYAADLVPLLVGVDTLLVHPENPNVGDIDGIAASLERFGQDRAILVQASTGHIVAGNHTYLAACRLGWGRCARPERAGAGNPQNRRGAGRSYPIRGRGRPGAR